MCIYVCVCVCVCFCIDVMPEFFFVVCADTVMKSFGDFREHSGDQSSKSQ